MVPTLEGFARRPRGHEPLSVFPRRDIRLRQHLLSECREARLHRGLVSQNWAGKASDALAQTAWNRDLDHSALAHDSACEVTHQSVGGATWKRTAQPHRSLRAQRESDTRLVAR